MSLSFEVRRAAYRFVDGLGVAVADGFVDDPLAGRFFTSV
jgi:hypothetical protein